MLLSVCIATYNGEQFIREQIDSILEQQFVENKDVELEIIISDDGSTDNTLKIVEAYKDRRIRVFHHEKKLKKYHRSTQACTRNFGYAISKATGDYIFLSDQDDVWLPLKMDKTLSVLRAKGGVCAVEFDAVSGDLVKQWHRFYWREPWWHFPKQYGVYGFSMGFTRKMARQIVAMPEIPHHDTFIMLLAIFCKDLHFIHETLSLHRYHGNNLSLMEDNPPLMIKTYYRMKMIFFAYWRSIKYRIGD